MVVTSEIFEKIEPNELEVRAARKLFSRECSFVSGATSTNAFPDEKLTEVAFAGRSNVGKSSLINALTGHKSLARISHTPGRTQQINFFNLGGELMLVDLPGYGYAKASKKSIRDWNRLTLLYLSGRASLRRVYLLVDSRHGLKDLDRNMMTMFDESAISFQVILTKCDKIKDFDLIDLVSSIDDELTKHVAAYPRILPTSSKSGFSIPLMRVALAELLQ
ncbi:MAG: ribosome biogenesis GTP-binding protein YihA/YsxC [Pseudomonadota bacterium]|nr:ribosome biogenesis GTP-binding protein YihA/YsxC [Pseudomonadota bacterium]